MFLVKITPHNADTRRSFFQSWFRDSGTLRPRITNLVNLLLLVDAVLSRPTVHQQEETANNRENLEEVVLREVLVGVRFVELQLVSGGADKVRAVLLTVQKLLTKRLKMLRITTSMVALNFALKPTTTMTHATKPSAATSTRQKLQVPLKTNPTNKKIRRTLPASWKYILRSFSSISGSPANAFVLRTHESERTMRRPPMTDRLRRKKFRSKMRP